MARTVLLADDSVTAQNMGRRILTDAGYDVITVNNGSAALKKIHESHPDLIVLDVYMPGYGGLEVCQRLKESGETMRIPVLLSVGKMEPFKADEAKRVRADAHIVKPFEASELLAALAKLEDRIVPQGDSLHGRKPKKPSFWHGEDDGDAQTNGKQVRQHKDGQASEAPAEAVQESPEAAPKVGAFPPVVEASGELPVIADGSMTEESTIQQNPAEAEADTTSVAGATSAPLTEPSSRRVADDSAASRLRSESAEPAVDCDAVSQNDNADPVGTENSPALQRKESDDVDVTALATAEPSPATDGSNSTEATSPSAGHWVAEDVALSPEEAALELDQEMRAAEAAESMKASAPTGETPAIAPEETQGATFAAAASAGSSATVVSAARTTTSEDTEAPAPSEAAAAWENWQHIRETVINGQTATAIVETVPQAATAAVQAEPAMRSTPNSASQAAVPTGTSAAESSSSEMESGALASIVDSVLAERKPKLMEEIAKKLKK